MYVIINWLVHPQEEHSTWFTTHVCSPGIFTETDTETDAETDIETDTDMYGLTKILDHGHDYSEGFDSAELYFEPQPTDFSTHKGLVPFTVF